MVKLDKWAKKTMWGGFFIDIFNGKIHDFLQWVHIQLNWIQIQLKISGMQIDVKDIENLMMSVVFLNNLLENIHI